MPFHSFFRQLQKSSNDLVFALRGTPGLVLKVPPELNGANLTQGTARVTPGPNVDPDFLLYAIGSDSVQKDIMRRLKGSTFREISLGELNKVRVQIPPLPEQRKIAEILSTWDKAIALTEQLIAAKQQRKKALMQQLLTGKRRFVEFEGKPWQEVRLGEVFKERKETGFESLPLLAITAEEGIVYRDTLNRRDTSTPDKSRYLRTCPGDIGYNTMRMWQGRSGVSELEGIVSPAYTICTPKPSVDVYFMGYLFKFPSTIHLFRRYSQGLVSDTWNLKFNAFAVIKVKIPKLEEQKKIAAVLKACDTEIDLLTQKVATLQRQKKGLMRQLLTGRTRVKV